MKISAIIFMGFLILIYSCTSHADRNTKKFTLQGQIKAQDSGIVVLSYATNDTLISDTAEIKNGKFFISGKVLEPTMATIRDGNDLELAVVYLEPQKMKITIFKDKLLRCKMTGSKTQDEYAVLNKMEEPVYERLIMIKEQAHNINDSIKTLKDGPAKLLLEKKREEIDSLWSGTRDELDPIELRFVLENPKSFVTLDYLPRLESREIISLDSLKSIFNGLDNSLRKSNRAKYITENIRQKENVSIGAQAPDFKATDYNQQTVMLSQFKGKSVVLLDFWASWCVPCRKSIPHVKSIYKKYHSIGLDVIAVSVDEKRNDWIEAIKQDSIDNWYNILIAEKWPYGPISKDDIFQNYYYRGVPEQLLIDINGKIIYRFGGYSKENEESLDKILSEIFDN
jgi:peroxiredoxin